MKMSKNISLKMMTSTFPKMIRKRNNWNKLESEDKRKTSETQSETPSETWNSFYFKNHLTTCSWSKWWRMGIYSCGSFVNFKRKTRVFWTTCHIFRSLSWKCLSKKHCGGFILRRWWFLWTFSANIRNVEVIRIPVYHEMHI